MIEFYQTCQEEVIPILPKPLRKERKKHFQSHSIIYEAGITLLPRPKTKLNFTGQYPYEYRPRYFLNGKLNPAY